jgi:hypothetical protein
MGRARGPGGRGATATQQQLIVFTELDRLKSRPAMREKAQTAERQEADDHILAT